MNLAATCLITPERLMGFTFGFAPPVIIETGIRLGIFDLLDKGARSIGEIAASSGASARGLRIVLNALVGLDLLAKDRLERYSLTPESRASRSADAFGTSLPIRMSAVMAALGAKAYLTQYGESDALGASYRTSRAASQCHRICNAVLTRVLDCVTCANLAHRRDVTGDGRLTERVRFLRARLVTSLPGGLGIEPAGTMTGARGASL
jgi:hypothetical protein